MTAASTMVTEGQALFARLNSHDTDLKRLTAFALVELHRALANLHRESPDVSARARHGTTAVALLTEVAGEARRRRRISRDDDRRLRVAGDEVRRVLSAALSVTHRRETGEETTTPWA